MKNWNFYASWFLTLHFPSGVTIFQNFQGGKLVFPGISKDKVTNLKFPGGFQKNILNPICLGFFSGIAHSGINNSLTVNSPLKAHLWKFSI